MPTYGKEAELVLGSNYNCKILIRFEIKGPGVSAQIQDARLGLYAIRRTESQGMQVDVWQVARPWVETEASWTERAAGLAWGAAGLSEAAGDVVSGTRTTQTINVVGDYAYFNVTEYVKRWHANSASNFGLLLVPHTTASLEYRFGSSEHSSTQMRPKLELMWLEPSG